MIENVILVDENDQEVGVMEKMQAHKEAVLHRAFSVFLWNENNELLLQKRQVDKYHCGGLWTNTCCSHPKVDETLAQAVERRLREEMDIACDTNWMYSFVYKADLGNGLFEHEFDHVYFGEYSGDPSPDANEVEDWKYMGIDALKQDILENPDHYTPWFKIILKEVLAKGILNTALN